MVNQLFLWPFSIANCECLPGRVSHVSAVTFPWPWHPNASCRRPRCHPSRTWENNQNGDSIWLRKYKKILGQHGDAKGGQWANTGFSNKVTTIGEGECPEDLCGSWAVQRASPGDFNMRLRLCESLDCPVGGAITILKNMSSSIGRIIPYIMEHKECLTPPTSCILIVWS